MANKIPRVPVREQDPKVRATNFEEVCYGYNVEEATLEASRCLNCKNPRCVAACPVNIRIPDFIHQVVEGNFAAAAAVISEDSSLPSVCGRVCPQESQCEGSCILGIKSEPVAVGKLERFVGDWKIENADKMPAPDIKRNGHKVAVIGSGPSGLACASDLARMGYEVKIFEALHKVGGVLVYGIPEFRLPKEKIVAREVEAVKKLGVEIETDVIVGRTVTIDLGASMSVDGVAMEFLQNKEHGVYCPRTLTVSLSENGTDFETVATVEKPVSNTANGRIRVPYTADFEKARARYVRVHFDVQVNTFLDEIEVSAL